MPSVGNATGRRRGTSPGASPGRGGRPKRPINTSAEDLLVAFQATGAPFWEAVGMVASTPHGPALASREWASYLQAGRRGAEPIMALLGIAAASPRLANNLLQVWLRDRHLDATLDLIGIPWVKALPSGLVVEGDLCLSGLALRHLPGGLNVGGNLEIANCLRLERLPDGLRVGGDLWADGCQSLSRLPADLVVDGDLLLRGCRAWDGMLPVDARVGGRVLR